MCIPAAFLYMSRIELIEFIDAAYGTFVSMQTGNALLGSPLVYED